MPMPYSPCARILQYGVLQQNIKRDFSLLVQNIIDVCIVGRRRRNRWPTRTDFEINPKGPSTFSYKVKYLHETFSILF